LRTDTNFEPYLVDMESLIQGLSVYDRHGPHIIHSLVPINEKLVVDERSSLPTEMPYWLNRLSNSQLPKNVLLFKALAIPLSECSTITIKHQGSLSSMPWLGLGTTVTMQVLFTILYPNLIFQVSSRRTMSIHH